MSETRTHTSSDNASHLAEISQRRRPFAFSKWQIALLIILLIPAVIGLIDVLSRIAAWYSFESAAADTDSQLSVNGRKPPADDPQSQTSNQIIPVKIEIPSIGVAASVENVGLNAQGAMQAPRNFTDAGWYGAGSAPGSPGNAVFDGHVNNALTKAGIFEHLAQLQPGDMIIVSDSNGRPLSFIVQAVKTYPVDAAPAQEIFSRAGPPGLALITCDGVWNDTEHQFSNRLVVYATRREN